MATIYAVSVNEEPIAPVKPAEDPFVFEEKVVIEEGTVKVAKTKNNPEAEDLANGTNITTKNPTKTKTAPSREAAAETDKTKRIFDMKKKPNKKPSQEAQDNQAKAQTECVEASGDYEFFKGELGCDFTKDKMYKCENISYCHVINPDNAVAGGNPKMGKANATWDVAGAATIKEANGAIRKPEDAQAYNCGDRYNKGDLVNFCGKSYECINPKSCSAGRKDKKACVKPGKKAAGVWQKPKTGKGETALDTVPESAQLKIKPWKRGAKKYEYAYTVGAIALNKVKKGDTSVPKPYECNPETITGKKLKPKQFLKKSMKNKKDATKPYKVVRGCIKYAPGSKGGNKFWVDVSEDVEIADIMPEIEAATFEKDGDYGKDDFTVAGGAIYTCIDDNFCKQEPTSKYGSKGWEKTAYSTAGIKDFKASDKPKPKIQEGAWNAKQMYSKSAISRPDKTKEEFFKCLDEKLCRKNAPNKTKKDGSVTGWKLEEVAEEITKMKAGKVRPVKDVKLQEVIAEKFDAAAKTDYKENTIVGAGKTDDANAYQCMESTCGKELTEEKGWIRLNKTATIKTADELKAATVDCMDFSVDVPYRADDLVTIDKAVFKCNPKRAEECGQNEPTETDGDAAGEVWIPDATKVGKSIGLPKSEEVDAIPAELIYENADKMTMKKDDYTQFNGVVFKCAKEDGTCTSLLKSVGDEIKKQEKADTKGETDIDYMGIIKTKLLDTKAFEQSFNKASKPEEEYGSAEDLKDENKAAGKDYAFMCDASEKVQDKLFTKGQTFCDPKTGEAFTCEDELKCNEAATDPQANDAGKKAKEAFTAVWKKVDEEKTKGKMFVTKQDRTPKDSKGTIKKTKAYDWTKTTSDDFTGTYTFKPNELAKDGKRLYKCAAKEEECAKTQPSKDKEGKVWKITTLPADEWSQTEIDSKQSKQKSCFDYEEGYAFLQNDSVCDPDYPTKGIWTCLDATECSNNKPNLKKVKELQKVWALTMEKFYMKDGEKKVSNTIIKRDTTKKPKEGAPVQCKDFEDFESGNDSKDGTIGSQLYWCEKGRVYKCNEKEKEVDSKTEKDAQGNAKKIKVREVCSNGCQPSSDNSGAWSMVRQRGSVQKLSKDEINKRFGEERKVKSCMDDTTFAKSHASWDKKEVTAGVIKLADGVACSEDKETQRKQWASAIESRGKLPEDYVEWPKNAKIIDQTFRCGKQLDQVLKGIKFNYKQAKPEFLNIMSWFPSICGEAPEGSTRDVKQICREEFAGIVTFALSGEMHEEVQKDAKTGADVKDKNGKVVKIVKNGPKDFDAAKTDKAMEWWQTAFSKSADRTCFKAENISSAAAKTAKCENQQAGDTGKGAMEQDTTKFYYPRGAGPLPLQGPQEYNEFSKAMTGSEDTFGKSPEKVMTEGNPIGEFEGSQISGMPIAVALWRYTQYYHSFLPSMHDVIVGMWKPRTHEKAAGLEEGKFCSVVSLVVAMSALRAAPGKGWAPVSATLINETTFITDGSLGEAYRNIYRAFGIRIADQGTKTGQYDYKCSKTKNWPEPDAKDTKSRQMIFLKPNTTSGKCEFTAEKSAYNAFQEGDVKRCFMDSSTADKDKKMTERRASIKDDRQACKLWDIKSQVMFDKDEIACIPLDKTKCDDKCLADPKQKKHAIYKCLKEKDCMQTSPLDKTVTGVWVEDKSKVADNNTTDPGLKYKVERAKIGAKEVECIEFKVMSAEEKTRFTTKLTPYDKNSKDAAIKDPKKKMLYVCSKGRAFKCIKQKADKSLDIEGCFAAGAKGPKDDDKGNWEIVKGAKGKIQPKFEDKYPDCLVPKVYRDQEQAAIVKAGGAGKTSNEATNKEMEKKVDMSAPVQMLIPDSTGAKYTAANLDGIFADKYGGLCTNMKTQTSYEVNAFINSVVDSQFTYTKARTMSKDGYKDVANASKFGAFTAFPNVMNAKTHLTEDMFKSITGSQAKTDFLKYYDFLNAVSMAPMFCGADGAGYYKYLPASAMCKKELAAFFATGISFTNEGDKAKTQETTDAKGVKTAAKGYEMQGFKHNEKSECSAANKSKRTAADKAACEKKVSDTDKTGAFSATGLCKATCSMTKEYYPRGPGQMQGAQEYFWFNKIALGDDKSVIGDPDKLIADGRTYFMSGIFKWMVPFGGRPSPHAIITGQWKPSKEEMQASIPNGYGAIINLVDGTNLCGKFARYPKARQMTEVWVAMKKLFKLDAVSVTENGRAEVFNTMRADEKDDCEGAEAAVFPKGLFGKFPIYFVKSYKDVKGATIGAKSGKCFATPTPSEFVVYEKDAYRKCAFANKA